MADFKLAFNKLAISGGGYVNDPDDAGGETYMGISRKYNPTWRGWVFIDNIKKVYGTKNVNYHAKKNESLQELVEERYKSAYWDIYDLDNIPNQEIAYQIFDTTVNCGQKAAIKMAERVLGCNETGRYNSDLMNKLKSIQA